MKKRPLQVIAASLLALLVTVFFVGCGKTAPPAPTGETQTKTPLFAYVGANLKDPVSELAQKYEEKTGVKVEMTFHNSGTLINQLEMMKKGDIYMPGGMPYVEKAKQGGHIAR